MSCVLVSMYIYKYICMHVFSSVQAFPPYSVLCSPSNVVQHFVIHCSVKPFVHFYCSVLYFCQCTLFTTDHTSETSSFSVLSVLLFIHLHLLFSVRRLLHRSMSLCWPSLIPLLFASVPPNVSIVLASNVNAAPTPNVQHCSSI